MLKVSISEDKDTVCVIAEGHTGYAEEGKDIVCAGVSALLQTFLLWLMEEYGERLKVKKEKGFLRMIFPANPKSKFIFSIFLKGLREISKLYPDYFEIEEVNKDV